jgi:hypothetical protein
VPSKIRISDEEIVSIIKPALRDAKDWGDQLSNERKRCRDLYDMAPLGNERDGFSRSVASTVYEAVEWMKPGLCAIFSHPDFFTIKMADAERGDKVRKVLRHQLFVQQKGERAIRDFVDTALKYHLSPLKICYVEEFDDEEVEFDRLTTEEAAQLEQDGYQFIKFTPKEAVDPMTGEVATWLEDVKTTRREIKFRGPKFMPVPAWEFYTTAGSRDVDTARIVAHRTPSMMHDIKVGENAGIYRKGSYERLLENLPDETGGSLQGDITVEESREQYDNEGLTVAEYDNGPFSDDHQAAKAARPIDIWEIYTRLDIDDDGLLEPVIVRMVGDVVLSVEKNPYKRPPFRVGRLIEVAHRLEGKAMPLVLESDQRELSNLQRFFVDAAAEAACPTAVTSDAEFQAEWNDRVPGESLLVNGDVNSKVSFPQVPGPNPAVLQAIEMREGGVERKSGVSRYNQGLDADSLNKTATGISIISSSGQQRQKFYAKVLGETLQDALRDMVEINRMWEPHIEDVDMQPEPGLFDGHYSIEIEVGVGPQDRMAQSQFLIQHQQWLTGFAIPQGAATLEHAIKTQAKIGKLQGVPFDDLMLPPDGFEGNQQAMQQLQGLQQQLQQVQQENAKLQQAASKNSPELRQAEMQAEYQFKSQQLQQEMELKWRELQEKMTLEWKKLEGQLQIAAAKSNAPVPAQDGGAGQTEMAPRGEASQQPVVVPVMMPSGGQKQIVLQRDESGQLVGAVATEVQQ